VVGLAEGAAEGWRRGHERTLPPFVTRAGSASVHFFCFFSLYTQDAEIGCPHWWAWDWNWITIRLARIGSYVWTHYWHRTSGR
jgi:hypothetical protein